MKIWDLMTQPARLLLWLLVALGTHHTFTELKTWMGKMREAKEAATERLMLKHDVLSVDDQSEVWFLRA